jgi:hypothetical protein
MSRHPSPEDDDFATAYFRQQIEQFRQREYEQRVRAAERRTGSTRAPRRVRVVNPATHAPLADRSVLPTALLQLGPNVIGGSGGSGTRVVARIARRAGMFTGASLNEADDEMTFFLFDERWIDPYVLAQTQERIGSRLHGMIPDFETVIAKLCAFIEEEPRPWGWKMPRSILLLPFLHEQFPAMKFVHVIRDGRYMAYSKQDYILRRHGFILLDPAEQGWSQPAQAMALWRRMNLDAADYGERRMADRYLRLRFEDLCAEPVPIVQHLLDFLGLAGDAAAITKLEVQAPPATRPWERDDAELVAELEAIGRDALQRFGYLSAVIDERGRIASHVGSGQPPPR